MTRGQIDILRDDKILTRLFIASDAYPEGIMKAICEKYSDYEEVNGISIGKMKIYNGIGDYISQLIYFLKEDNRRNHNSIVNTFKKTIGIEVNINNESGWLYVMPTDEEIGDVEYRYNIYSKDNKLYVSCVETNKLFEGTMNEYLKWLEERKDEE